MEWTSADILSVLYIVVAVMLIIVLYHVLFIVVDVRKTMRRVDRVSASLESAVLKPISLADRAFDWVIEHVAGEPKHSKHHVHHKKHHE